jgi:hypothetical protein
VWQELLRLLIEAGSSNGSSVEAGKSNGLVWQELLRVLVRAVARAREAS